MEIEDIYSTSALPLAGENQTMWVRRVCREDSATYLLFDSLRGRTIKNAVLALPKDYDIHEGDHIELHVGTIRWNPLFQHIGVETGAIVYRGLKPVLGLPNSADVDELSWKAYGKLMPQPNRNLP